MNRSKPRFAIIGVAGFVARRHLEAVRDVGGDLVAAFDVSDSVGQMDSYFPAARFFTDFAQFDAFLHDLRARGAGVDYVSICSPNHLHKAHVAVALRAGADAICEKPLVLTLADADAVAALERETGRKVATILQLRLNPSNIALRDELGGWSGTGKLACDLTYVTSRGLWYYESWKGHEAKSGGIATNIGVHFFDLLGYMFGAPLANHVHHRAMDCAAGVLEFEKARVRWFLSINGRDLPPNPDDKVASRRISIGDRVINLSGDFRELHTLSYQEILAGRIFTVADTRPAISMVEHIRSAPLTAAGADAHPSLAQVLADRQRYRDGYPV